MHRLTVPQGSKPSTGQYFGADGPAENADWNRSCFSFLDWEILAHKQAYHPQTDDIL